MVLGGYGEAAARPSLRLGPRYGLPAALLGLGWAAAYSSAAASLALLLKHQSLGISPVRPLPLFRSDFWREIVLGS